MAADWLLVAVRRISPSHFFFTFLLIRISPSHNFSFAFLLCISPSHFSFAFLLRISPSHFSFAFLLRTSPWHFSFAFLLCIFLSHFSFAKAMLARTWENALFPTPRALAPTKSLRRTGARCSDESELRVVEQDVVNRLMSRLSWYRVGLDQLGKKNV